MSTSPRQDFHEAVYRFLGQFVTVAETMSKKEEVMRALETAPTEVTKGRDLAQIAFDDLMTAYATVMRDVDPAKAPTDFFFFLHRKRDGFDVTREESNALFGKMVAEQKSAPPAKEPKVPNCIGLLPEDTDPMIKQALASNLVAAIHNFGQLNFSDEAIQANQAAGALAQATRVALNKQEQARMEREMKMMFGGAEATGEKPKNTLPVPVGNGGQSGRAPLPANLAKMLSQFGENTGDAGAKLGDDHGRDADVKRLARVLLQREGGNAVLFGGEGIGKNTVVEALARDLNNGNGPGRMKSGHVYSLNVQKMILEGGQMAQAALMQIMDGAVEHNKKNPHDPVILHFNGIGNNSRVLAQPLAVFRTLIAHKAQSESSLKIVASATNQELFLMDKEDPGFVKIFQKIKLDELPRDLAASKLRAVATELSAHHGVDITEDAIAHAVKKTDQFMPGKFRPGKGIDILISAVAEAELNGDASLSEKAIDAVIAEKTGLPAALIGGEASERIDNLESNVLKRVFGQDHAVKKIANTVKLVNRGLHDPKKPLGVFYMSGPTGVGKTELAKAIAEALFEDESALISVNLADFAEKHTVARIVGSPPGYVGYGDKTALEDVEHKPFSVVLFDEAEKAHADVDNALMKVMDEGKLTLLNGKELNFRNCVLIFTSNLGASAAEEASERSSIGFSLSDDDGASAKVDAANEERERAAKARLKPEFRGRATFINLDYLSPDVAQKIALHKVDEVSKSLRMSKLYTGLKVELSPNALKELMSVGYERKYGARPMNAAIRDYIKVPLNDWLGDNADKVAGKDATLVINSLKKSFAVTVRENVANENKAGTKKGPAAPSAMPG